MQRLVLIIVVLTFSSFRQAAEAQEAGPIRNPLADIQPQISPDPAWCIEDWHRPEPALGVRWLDYPPEGLVEEIPQTLDGNDWITGVDWGWGPAIGPTTFAYDESGRPVTSIMLRGELGERLEDSVLTSYAYDESGNLVDVSVQGRQEGTWANIRRSIYRYDEKGRATSETQIMGNGTAWEVEATVTCQYDEAGRLKLRVVQACTPMPLGYPNPPCADADSTTYTYDSFDRIIREYGRTVHYEHGRYFGEPDVEEWFISRLIDYTYDETDRLVQKITTGRYDEEVHEYLYDDEGRLLEETLASTFDRSRTRYAYQHAGLLTRRAEDAWDYDQLGWIENGEVRYEYDALLNLRAESRFMGGGWNREEYEYDGDLRLTAETSLAWAGSTEGWSREVSHGIGATYEYDHEGLLTEYQRKAGDETWGGGFEPSQERVLYRYAVGTGVSHDPISSGPGVRLGQSYPNPVHSVATMSYELARPAKVELSVFDLMGRRVGVLDSGSRGPGRHEVAFDGTGLPSGVYFYRLDADGTVSTRRLVLAK